MIVNPYLVAERFLGQHEVTGDHDNVFILWCLSTCTQQPLHDEIAWCSAFVNAMALIADVPRSHSLAARSWLTVGLPIELPLAESGDVVVLSRGDNSWSGHVGFYAAQDAETVSLLGGNQGDKVSLAIFPKARVLGVRRLAT